MERIYQGEGNNLIKAFREVVLLFMFLVSQTLCLGCSELGRGKEHIYKKKKRPTWVFLSLESLHSKLFLFFYFFPFIFFLLVQISSGK